MAFKFFGYQRIKKEEDFKHLMKTARRFKKSFFFTILKMGTPAIGSPFL